MAGGAEPVRTRLCVCIVSGMGVGLMTSAVSLAGSPPPPPVSLGVSSQQAGPSRARVSASIAVRTNRRGREGTNANDRGHVQVISVPHRGGSGDSEPLYPALPNTSPFLRNPHPFGPDSF